MTSIKGQIRNNTSLLHENEEGEQRLDNSGSVQEGGMADMHARLSKLNREISQIDQVGIYKALADYYKVG